MCTAFQKMSTVLAAQLVVIAFFQTATTIMHLSLVLTN